MMEVAFVKKGIVGKKLGMTQVFKEDGTVVPVTVIQAGPCVVTQIKLEDNDGYSAVQLGYDNIREKLVNKPEKGHFDKAGIEYKRYLKEFRLSNSGEYKVGDEIKADIFSEGDKIDIAGTTKGKGFAGAIKRWNQHRGPMKHGSRYHRRPGSMGASASPAHVLKGKRLPGRMGHDRVTVQNLEIVRVDAEKNLILVKGSVPGIKGAVLELKESVKQ